MTLSNTLFPSWERDIAAKYDFIDELGTGGYRHNTRDTHLSFATVWRVKRKTDDEFFACKVLNKSNLSEEDLTALKTECEIMQDMEHKNIVKVRPRLGTTPYLSLYKDSKRTDDYTLSWKSVTKKLSK